MLKSVSMIGLVAMVPAVATAHEGAEEPRAVLHVGYEYEECYFDLHPELTEAELEEFAGEAGQIVRFRQLSSADTLGAGVIDISVAGAYVFVDDTKGAWNNTMSHPGADHYLGQELGFPQLSLRVGVGDDVDLEAYGAVNPGANYGFAGVATKIRLVDQADGRPVSVSVRPSMSALVGPEELQLINVSADVAVSRTIHGFTPFAGFTMSSTAVRETSAEADVDPQVASRSLAFAGVEVRYKGISAAVQAELSDLAAIGARVGGSF